LAVVRIKRPKEVVRAKYCTPGGRCCAVGALAYGSGYKTKKWLRTLGGTKNIPFEYDLSEYLGVSYYMIANLRAKNDASHPGKLTPLEILEEFVDAQDNLEWEVENVHQA
jgi:hypothetical protein